MSNIITMAAPDTLAADLDLVYTVKEAAHVLRIGRSKFYDLLSAGEVESLHIGARRVVRREALVRYLDGLAGSAA